MNYPQWSVRIIHEYPIFFIDGKPLHSIKNPTREHILFRNSFDLDKYDLYILVGVGCGYVLDVFKQGRTPLIILFQDLQEKAIYEATMSSEKTDYIQIYLIDDPIWKDQYLRFEPNKIGVWVNPTYYKLLSRYESLRYRIDDIFTYMTQSLMNRITDAAFGKRWWRNMIHNYLFQNVQPLELPKAITDIPILLIGSGYTTFEHIYWILAHKDSFKIFTVLPVLDLLLAHGIMPDVVVMTDGGSANRHYTAIRNLDSSTILICYPHVYPLILEWFSGQVLMINSGLEGESQLMPEMPLFFSGGSVASTMLDLAKCYSYYLYHIGFDFAYTSHHLHYPGSPLESQWLFEAQRLVPAESKFSQRLYHQTRMVEEHYTTSVLIAYRHFFYYQIEHLSPHYKVKKLNLKDPFSPNPSHHMTLPILGKEPINPSIRRERLTALLSMLDEDIQNHHFHNPLWGLITSQAKIKNQPLESVLQKESRLMHHLLNSVCSTNQS